MAHRSTMHNVVQFIGKLKEEKKITQELLEAFDRTPFKTFLRAIYDGRFRSMQHKPNIQFSRMAKCFNKETCLFDFNSEVSLGITKKDVALLYGFPLEPMETAGQVKKKRSDPNLIGVKTKYFSDRRIVIYQTIIGKIRELMEQPQLYIADMLKDITILIISSLCASLFLPNNSEAFNKNYFDDIEPRMYSTDWPQLILDKLIDSLKNGDNQSKKGLCGCAMLLLYWFVERVDADPKETHKNLTPRTARWVLADVGEMIRLFTFADLKKDEVFEEMINISEVEIDFLKLKKLL